MSQARLSRRRFLTATLGVGTAAAAAALASRQGEDSRQAQAADKKQGRGYQLTEHVKNYYRTAQV